MKTCLYASVIGLLVGLSAIIVYAYAVNDIKSVKVCKSEGSPQYGCPQDGVVVSFCGYNPPVTFHIQICSLFIYYTKHKMLKCF